MAACSRPVIEAQSAGRWSWARCLTCTTISPKGEDADGPWAQQHRSEAVAANCEIGDKGRAA